MAFKSFYDTNHDGFLSGFEKSRYEMDNIGYPTYATPDYASELYERDLLKNNGFDTRDTDFMYDSSSPWNDFDGDDEDADDDGFEDDDEFDDFDDDDDDDDFDNFDDDFDDFDDDEDDDDDFEDCDDFDIW